jgi:hypothetical protein
MLKKKFKEIINSVSGAKIRAKVLANNRSENKLLPDMPLLELKLDNPELVRTPTKKLKEEENSIQ